MIKCQFYVYTCAEDYVAGGAKTLVGQFSTGTEALAFMKNLSIAIIKQYRQAYTVLEPVIIIEFCSYIQNNAILIKPTENQSIQYTLAQLGL
jgi:hypothetical protein